MATPAARSALTTSSIGVSVIRQKSPAPFGGGAHMCLGLHFAYMQAKCFAYHLLGTQQRVDRRGLSAALADGADPEAARRNDGDAQGAPLGADFDQACSEPVKSPRRKKNKSHHRGGEAMRKNCGAAPPHW